MVIVNSNCHSCYVAFVPEAVREFENQLEDKAKAVLEFNNNTSIFLIGMMASGKSTVGRIVADALSYHFSDRYGVILVVCSVMQDKSKCHRYYMDLTIYVFHVYSPQRGDAICNFYVITSISTHQ